MLDEISMLQFGAPYEYLEKEEKAMALGLLDGGIQNYEAWRAMRITQQQWYMWEEKQR